MPELQRRTSFQDFVENARRATLRKLYLVQSNDDAIQDLDHSYFLDKAKKTVTSEQIPALIELLLDPRLQIPFSERVQQIRYWLPDELSMAVLKTISSLGAPALEKFGARTQLVYLLDDEVQLGLDLAGKTDEEKLARLNIHTDEEIQQLISLLKPDCIKTLKRSLPAYEGITPLLRSSGRVEYLQYIASTEYQSWIKPWLTTQTTYLFSNLDTFFLFYRHSNRDTFMQFVTPDKLYSAVRLFPQFTQDIILPFLLQSPERHVKLLDIEYPEDPYRLTWATRIQHLERFLEIFELHGVTDKEISQLLFQAWKPTSEQIANFYWRYSDEVKDSFCSDLEIDNSSYETTIEGIQRAIELNPATVKQVVLRCTGAELYSSLHKGTPLSERQKLKDYIRQQKLEHNFPLFTTEHVLSEIDFREDPKHPTTNLFPTCGSEVEHKTTKGMDTIRTAMLSRYGFHKGTGGSNVAEEAAHGPFRHPTTATAIMKRWIDAELFHWHEGKIPTLHFNLNLRSRRVFAQLIRIMYMTGFTFHPFFEDAQVADDEHSLRIHEKEKARRTDKPGVDVKYLESKDFDFTIPEAFDNQMIIGTILAVAAQAYETVALQYNVYLKSNHQKPLIPDNREHYFTLTRDLTEQEITTHSSGYVRKFALMWKQLLDTFRDGTDQIPELHLGSETVKVDHLAERVPMRQASAVAKKVQAIYPEPWSRYDARNLEKQTETTPISSRGKDYPNLVSFAQHTVVNTFEEINELLQTIEQEVYRQLAVLQKRKQYPKDYRTGVKKFVAQFPWLFEEIKIENYESVCQRIEELTNFYSEHNRI